MLTDTDIQRIRDDYRIERLRERAAKDRRFGNANGAAKAAQQRDAARRQAALDEARRLYGRQE